MQHARALPRALLAGSSRLTTSAPPTIARATSTTATSSLARSSTPNAVRALSTTRNIRAAASHDDGHGAHGHESHYDPPGGWLWGVPPGEKREREGWEIGAWIYVILLVGAGVAYSMTEDTS